MLLVLARALVAWAPFARWRSRLGQAGVAGPGELELARLLAAHVVYAAGQIGLPLKCLPRAMALSWMLRRRSIAHTLVIAARPQSSRKGAPDALHAWADCGNETVLGELEGPWIVTLRLP